MNPRGQLASPGIRIAARIVDFVVVSNVGALLARAAWATDEVVFAVIWFDGEFGFDSIDFDSVDVDVNAATIVFIVFGFLWEFLWTAFAAATPGKLLVGLRIADASSRRSPPSPAVAARRALNRLIPFLVFADFAGIAIGGLLTILISVASLILLFVDDDHRTVMDRIAGTIVIKKSSLPVPN